MPGVMCNVICLSDGTVTQFCPYLIRLHTFQPLVDMVHQYYRTFVIPNLYPRTRGKTQTNRLIKEEQGIVRFNVVPNKPLTRQIDTMRQVLDEMWRETNRKNQRKWLRKTVVAVASDGSEDMLQITPEHRAQLADKSDQTRKRKETGTWTSTGTKKTRTQTSDSSDTHHLDTGMLGKRVMVDTVGTRGKKYGSQEARIVVIEDNNYKAQYTTFALCILQLFIFTGCHHY